MDDKASEAKITVKEFRDKIPQEDLIHRTHRLCIGCILKPCCSKACYIVAKTIIDEYFPDDEEDWKYQNLPVK